MYVCMCGHHIQQSTNQPRKVANPVYGQLNREKFPCPRSRLIFWFRETGLALPSRASLLVLCTKRFQICFQIFIFPKIMIIYVGVPPLKTNKLGSNRDPKTWRQPLSSFYYPFQVRRPRSVRTPWAVPRGSLTIGYRLGPWLTVESAVHLLVRWPLLDRGSASDPALGRTCSRR